MRSKLPSVRETVAALRTALLSPSVEGITACVPALQEAALDLERLRAETLDKQSPDSGTRRELDALARELRGAGKLIAQGMAFTQGMARVLAPATADYRPDGEPVVAKTASTLLIRG